MLFLQLVNENTIFLALSNHLSKFHFEPLRVIRPIQKLSTLLDQKEKHVENVIQNFDSLFCSRD